MQPKILIGCPTASLYEYCIDQYLDGIKAKTYRNFNVFLVDNSENDDYSKLLRKKGIGVIRCNDGKTTKEKVINSRNLIRQKVLDEGYEYFLSLEQDVIPLPNFIEKLLNHDKKIITGIYYRPVKVNYTKKDGEIVKSEDVLIPVLYKFTDQKDKMKKYMAEEVEVSQLLRVRAAGLGCMLIHRSVLEKIKFRVPETSKGWDDVWFCKDAIEAGFEIFADTALKCKHLIAKKGWKWDKDSPKI
jgi:hypothetical protein